MSLSFLDVHHQDRVDAGYSGELVVTVARGTDGAALIFVESELLASTLVLTPQQSIQLAASLTNAFELSQEATS